MGSMSSMGGEEKKQSADDDLAAPGSQWNGQVQVREAAIASSCQELGDAGDQESGCSFSKNSAGPAGSAIVDQLLGGAHLKIEPGTNQQGRRRAACHCLPSNGKAPKPRATIAPAAANNDGPP
jgi:hypothetical protein